MPEAIMLFKYTSRSRKDNFFRGLDSIVSNLSNTTDYHILCTFDLDDPAYMNRAFMDRLIQYKNLSHYFGISHSKVDAINRDMGLAPPFDILVNFSDDQVIVQYAFDHVIRQKMGTNFDQVLHFKDTNNGDKLMTMTICGVDYYRRFGFIYHPAYVSVYCDLEAQDVARALGRYTFVDIVIFVHRHPAYQTAPSDAQYLYTESFYHKDGETYFLRKANFFDL